MEVFLVFADEWGEENDGSGVEAFVFFFFFRQWLIGSDCSRGGENRVASSFAFCGGIRRDLFVGLLLCEER